MMLFALLFRFGDYRIKKVLLLNNGGKTFLVGMPNESGKISGFVTAPFVFALDTLMLYR